MNTKEGNLKSFLEFDKLQHESTMSFYNSHFICSKLSLKFGDAKLWYCHNNVIDFLTL